MPKDSRRDNLLGAIAMFFVLIGMATGNAFAMLGLSGAGLVLTTAFCQRKIRSRALLVALGAAVVCGMISLVIAKR